MFSRIRAIRAGRTQKVFVEMATRDINFTDFLRTRSEYVMMEPAKREEMLGEIAKAIDDQGGELTLDYETHLYIIPRQSRGL